MPTIHSVALALGFAVVAPLAAADYPIVYVRAPRPAGPPKMPEVVFATDSEPAADLLRIDPGGQLTVLHDCDASCSVTDPSVSLDGQKVYFSVLHDPADALDKTLRDGCSIYRMPTRGGAVEPILRASDGWTQGLAAGNSPRYLPCYLAPQELPGNKLILTSNAWAQEPMKAFAGAGMQLFVLRLDTRELEAVAPMTLGSALHPILLTSGEVMFSTYESQGWRDPNLWALWSIYPDGRQWKPLVSAFDDDQTFHFQAQMTDGDIVVIDYYNQNNFGAGLGSKIPFPRPVPAFHSATDRAPIVSNTGASGLTPGFSLQPIGLETITPWSRRDDRPANCWPLGSTCSDAERAGKVRDPAAYPRNRLLFTWSAGPVTSGVAEPNEPWPDFGIYLTPTGGMVPDPADLELVIDQPQYNEHLARVVAPYAVIYGQQPIDLPWLPQHQSPYLPPGTPYGIVGTSSVFHRESAPGVGFATYGGLDRFNDSHNQVSNNSGSNWRRQGSETSLYDDSDIAAVRIVLLEPRLAGEGSRIPFRHFANERHRILGDVPIEADGSFWARIPADSPFTLQMISHEGESLTMAQTWHQVRPGEVRTDCGGCHAHSKKPIPFAQSIAATKDPTILDGPPENPTWLNRIAALIVGRVQGSLRGVPLGSLSIDAAYNCLADDRGGDCFASWLGNGDWRGTNLSGFVNGYRSRRSLLWWEAFGARRDGHTNADHSSTGDDGDLDYLDEIDWAPPLTGQERRDLAAWIDLGAPYGGASWDQDTARPVVHVEEPRSGPVAAMPRIRYGTTDADSGLDVVSVVASWTVRGRQPGQDLSSLAVEVEADVWEIDLVNESCSSAGGCVPKSPSITSGTVVVEARDVHGNQRRVERKFQLALPTPVPTPTPPILPRPIDRNP